VPRRATQLHLQHPLRRPAPDRAARKLAWLIREALRRELTGVGLTDESERALSPVTAQMESP